MNLLQRLGVPVACLVVGFAAGFLLQLWLVHMAHGLLAPYDKTIPYYDVAIFSRIVPYVAALFGIMSAFDRGTKVGNFAILAMLFFAGMEGGLGGRLFIQTLKSPFA